MSVQLNRLKNERTQIRRKFTESLNKLEQLLADVDVTQDQLNEEYVISEDRANRLFDIDEKVCNLIFAEETDEQELNREYDTMEAYRDRWTRLSSRKDLLNRI